MTEETRNCRYCGKTLKNRRSNALFCGDTHRVQYHTDKQRKQRDYVIAVYRDIVRECINEHPSLRNMVNHMLTKARVSEEIDW